MKLHYSGKTKDVYELENGHFLLVFKDSVTGSDGVFDPGANTVGLEIPGIGRQNLAVTTFFFEGLEAEGIRTHYVASDLEAGTMEVLPARSYGHGVEVICRFRAVGSFLRRYGLYVREGDRLPGPYVEMTLKDDGRGDPLITREGLEALGIMRGDEYDAIVDQTRRIANWIDALLERHDLCLYDIKLEFGHGGDGEPFLIDEISSGNMRVYRLDGKILEPQELYQLLLEERVD